MVKILTKLAKSPRGIKFMFAIWPPFWFTGIRIKYVSPDIRHLISEMSLRFYNKNIVGTQFGGNLFAMTDPCYMTLLMGNLGTDYRVWDSAASIKFLKPGRGKVTAEFILTDEDLADIYEQTKNGAKYFKTFNVDIFDADKEVVASLERTLYIREKRKT